MAEGWGFYVEGSAIRAYNNDLAYAFYDESLIPLVASVETVKPDWNFGLRVGVDYTLADSANIMKLFYEHIFDRNSSDSSEDYRDIGYGADVKVKLDGVTLLSEQHILIGPYWEATLSGGLRYARVEQQFNIGVGTAVDFEDDDEFAIGFNTTSQFNGVGPLGGVGGMFHVTENLAFGAEAQGALLLGRTKHSVENDAFEINSDDVTSIVPELFSRIYGNYFYRFNDGMELQVELGWRLNQFFNIETRYARDDVASAGLGLSDDTTAAFIPATVSDDIGFSGPYLSAHLKI
jgi:hypothetical protein